MGVSVALLFVFFTLRYFVRSKYGLLAYPLSHRGLILTLPDNIPRSADSSPIIDDRDLQQQLDYLREHLFHGEDFLGSQMLGGRRRRRQGRFSRMKKLKPAEVEQLFPMQTYHKWLNGGQDQANESRAGILHEDTTEDPDSSSDRDEVMDLGQQLRAVTSSLTAQASSSKTCDLIQSAGDLEKDQKEIAVVVEDAQSEDKLTSSNGESQGDLHFTSGTCAICLDVLDDDSIVRGLICGHVFHAECIDPWLTRRRACCPMCKRDYFYKSEQSGIGNNGETNGENNDISQADFSNQNDLSNQNDALSDTLNDTARNDSTDNRNQSSSDVDLAMIRNDPTLLAMLQEMVPIGERVRIILSNPAHQLAGIDQRATLEVDRRRSNPFKRFWWTCMGISRQDLYNSVAYRLFKEYRREQREAMSRQPPNEISEATGDNRERDRETRRESQEGFERREMVEQRV